MQCYLNLKRKITVKIGAETGTFFMLVLLKNLKIYCTASGKSIIDLRQNSLRCRFEILGI